MNLAAKVLKKMRVLLLLLYIFML